MNDINKIIKENFSKIYAIDTNIILNNFLNIFKLSDNNSNLIFIPKKVLQEIDKLKNKSYDEDIKYQIRKFQEAITKNLKLIKNLDDGVLISVNYFNNDYTLFISNKIIDKNNLNNDEIIIEEILYFKNKYNIQDKLICISNDILFKLNAITKNLRCESFKSDNYDIDNLNFFQTFELIDIEFEKKTNGIYSSEEIFKYINKKYNIDEKTFDYLSFIKLITKNEELILQRIDKFSFKKNTFGNIKKIHNISFQNLEQKMLIELLLNPKNDIVVVEGIAGTSKTMSALLAAIKLIEENQFDTIKYIRKTIISGNKFDEIGFLPGDLYDKIKNYLYPLKDNIEFIIKNKKKKKGKENLTLEEIQKEIQNFENKYFIEYIYQGHLRGKNLEGIIIIDEAQNFSLQDLRLLLSRIKKNSKVFILGSVGQIDTPYLNKNNNALSYMLYNSYYLKTNNNTDIQIRGIKLKNVIRGKIANWIENKFEEKNFLS